MFRFSSLMVLCAFAVSFSLAGAARADDTMGDNPAYQSWAKFKPGTMVTYSVDANTAGNTSSTQITQTLKDIDADKATIEVKMSMVMAGNKTDLPAMTHEIPAKIRKVDPATTQAAGCAQDRNEHRRCSGGWKDVLVQEDDDYFGRERVDDQGDDVELRWCPGDDGEDGVGIDGGDVDVHENDVDGF